MSGARLFLFDDRRARRWAPFTLTRPAGEMLFGCLTLRERAERLFALPCSGHLTRSALAGFDEPGARPVVQFDDVGNEGVRIFLSSRAVASEPVRDLPRGPSRIRVAGETVGWIVPDGSPVPSEPWLREPSSAPADGSDLDLPGLVLGRPWDLAALNAEQVRVDVEALWPGDCSPPGVFRVGDEALSLGEGAEIEAGVHVDTRHGPIRLSDRVRVEGPARLTGPLFVGPDSTVLGGSVGTSSIGPVCKVRGELTESILGGFVNKAHDGYLGHACVGQWVNLGAFTTNSDLKNNYGTVRVWTPDGERDTGRLKVGCFIGDHVKTGIGTVVNTGTVIGAGSNVYGGIMPPTVVPPFSWGSGPDLRDYRLDRFLESTERAMSRRGQELTPGVLEILKTAWWATAGRRAE